MHSTFGKRTLGWAGLLALVAVLLAPSPAGAVPEPGAKGRGFRLFARALGAITVNRVYCGLNSAGEVCVDSLGSSTIGGGYWPKGTADQYIFNSGLQLAGIISGGPWDGDTTGAFFFDPKGTTVHGNEVTPIYNSQNPADAAAWPDEARVPSTGPSSDFYDNLLKGRVAASQGDIWYLTWEGDPGLNAGRPHPLGIMAEVRGFGWNYPRGNEDILYFVYTFYNVTSLNPADYASARPELQPILLAQAQAFHTRNNATFGVTLPAGGYTISPLYAAFARDDDVADAGANYSSVNLPFALGYTYEHTFYGPNQVDNLGWTFPDAIFGPPFFKGPGFTGAKYLASPNGAGEIQLFSNTINGGDFNDAQNTTQLYRYLSGNISVAAGDEQCSYDPVADRVCYVNNTAEDDMRFFQSSTPLTLGPGESGSIVVAYIHAAPVALPGFAGDPGADIKPGDPTGLGDPVEMAALINQIDSLTGYLSHDDINDDDIVEQSEFVVVTGSLLGKALVAQTIFDNKFLLPFSPEVPEFFLVPGDNQVTVFWQPSASETTGDPFFAIASNALNPDLTVNALYDANYRDKDVEGYRIYRGRVDNPEELTLVAQYDKDNSTFSDYYGTVNPGGNCAPELGLNGTANGCATTFDDVLTPGVQLAAHADYAITGDLQQVTARVELADGSVLITAADTAVTGQASGFPGLSDTGIPFVYVDNAVRNGFRYFYAVTAYDVNSIRSGPTSLESARVTKSVTPRKDATNFATTGNLTVELQGRGAVLNTNAPLPTIDPATGVFSGPMPPANGFELGLVAFATQVLPPSGDFRVRLDSIQLGSAWEGTPHLYWYTATAADASSVVINVPIVQDPTVIEHDVTSPAFKTVALDDTEASRYGGSSAYGLNGAVQLWLPGMYLTHSVGRGAAGFGNGSGDLNFTGARYDGARWFEGDTETAADPTFANCLPNGCTAAVRGDNWNNAGTLPGVTVAHQPLSYLIHNLSFRSLQGVLGGAARAADIKVYWGAGGTVDSVIDVTHNVPVEFSPRLGSGWGFLTTDAQSIGPSQDANPALLTSADLYCVEPSFSIEPEFSVFGVDRCPHAAPYVLVNTAELGAIGFAAGDLGNTAAAAARPEPGFAMHVAGRAFIFQMPALPAAGTVWTLRGYHGGVKGGNGLAADLGDYSFYSAPRRALTATGVEIVASFTASNQVNASTNRDLSRVHTVPDPYYVTNEFEQTTETKIIKFVNLPEEAVIRIYSASGVLVRVIEHTSNTYDGEATWNVRNRNNQVVASGVYFYHIEAGEARKVGRFTVVNFAQ